MSGAGAGVGVAVMALGGLGALSRHALATWVQRRCNSTRPWGTVAVNLVGTALLAATIVGWRRGLVVDEALIITGAGFCAGFTTFSTWMVEAVHLAHGDPAGRRVALADLAGQLGAGVVVAALILVGG